MIRGFWERLAQPIIAPSPMDGVTDAAFRYITDTIGKPSLLMTEFTPVEGIQRGISRVLRAFIHHQTKTPTVAQIFGTDIQAFYQAACIIGEMGFDGIDINMGCPDSHVAQRGGGAALINNPKLAQEIMKTVQYASADWGGGKSLSDIGISQEIQEIIYTYRAKLPKPKRRALPVSVKTRIGFDAIVTESWISALLETKPAAITIHGRTLRQMYTGHADWDEIGKAARLIRQTDTYILGNGDIRSIADAKEKWKTCGVHGVLIGRGCLGNPWIFCDRVPTDTERFQTALEHCRALQRFTPDIPFVTMRKHLAWYVKYIHGSHLIKEQLMHVNSIDDVEHIFKAHDAAFNPLSDESAQSFRADESKSQE